MRILIAVPCSDGVSPETFKSIYGLDTSGHTVFFDYQRGYDCALARNRIAREALAGGFDCVLMVDADVSLPSDALKFLAEPPAPIVCGVYVNRHRPEFAAYCHNGNKDYVLEIPMAEIEACGAERIHVKGGGMGCALISADVFKSLEYPWFKFVDYGNGDVLSEDLYFCEKANAAGFRVMLDARVRCGHEVREIRR